jgi:cobalt-zinc-cadmium efflux system outer membrane protein
MKMCGVSKQFLRVAGWYVGMTVLISSLPISTSAQAVAQTPVPTQVTTSIYLDPVNGRTVDDLVSLALENNPELTALRKEAEAGEALVKQAGLRPNPMVEVSGAERVGGADNTRMVQGSQPLELGGRRPARIRVAQSELEIRKQAVAERERQLAADVRSKFGEALAEATKLTFIEERVQMEKVMFELVAERVTEGRTPPLEQNMETVELNRMRADRETTEGVVEMRMFELRNMVGMAPEEPLRLRGDFPTLLGAVPPQEIATERALQVRPDIVGARAVEQLQAARIEQAKAEGRIDADVMLGYQRMKTGFPLLGIEESTGALRPIMETMHFFTFGVRLNIPVTNRNQGAVEAARLEGDAARDRRAFGELTIKSEIASAYARYNRALRAMEIYRVGVRDQAGANLDVVRQTYDLGSKTLLDYVGEHHRFIATENGFIDAELEAYRALVDILRATYASELINK